MARKPPFAVEYNHRGKAFATTVGGDSWEDAVGHLKSIGANGRIVGSDVSTIPVNHVTLPIVHCWASAMALFRRLWRRS